jgi:serine protease Do
VIRGRIGVVIQPITKELADGFGLSKAQGALVNQVEKGGPAEKAGVEPGDVILRFDGKPVTSSEDLPRVVGATKPGSRVSMQIWRNKTAREVQVTVAELQDDRAAAQQKRGAKPPAATPGVFGMSLSELTEAQRKELKVEGGVLVNEAQGAAARAGIRRGDVILAVNNQDVKSVQQFSEMMGQVEKGRIVALLVRRGGNSLYIPFRVDGN